MAANGSSQITVHPRTTLLQTLHLSSHSELEADSDGEIEFISEPGGQSGSRRNGEKVPLMRGLSSEDDSKWGSLLHIFILFFHRLNVFDDPEYTSVIQSAEQAIDEGVLPVRIYQGSSGSYFVRSSVQVSECVHSVHLNNAHDCSRGIYYYWILDSLNEHKKQCVIIIILFINYFIRRISGFLSLKMKSHTVTSTQSGRNGCTRRAARAVSGEAV